MISLLHAETHTTRRRCATISIALCLGITMALLLFDAFALPLAPERHATRIGTEASAQELAQFQPADVISWSRHLAAGGALEFALAGPDNSELQSEGAPPIADGAADARAVETLLALESLGPLSLSEKAGLYEDELRRLAAARQEQAGIGAAGTMDALAHCEVLELQNDELRMLATLELLDTDEYWVFAEGSPGPQVLGPLIGRYGLRPLMRDGGMVQIMFPYASDRFPLLASLAPARRQAEEAAASALLQEFNGLPEVRRALYRDLLAHPDTITDSQAPFVQRYQWPALAFDPQTLTMFIE